MSQNLNENSAMDIEVHAWYFLNTLYFLLLQF